MYLFVVLLAVIAAISLFDLRKIIMDKQYNDMVFFIAYTVVSLALGYYYSTHIYTASLSGYLLKLFNIK